MTNLELITFNVVITHPDGRSEIITTDAYDMNHAWYKAKNSNPFCTITKVSPCQMF